MNKLFALLRPLRREITDAENLPPYVVLSDFPQSPQRFLAGHSVGERKLAQHGERFLTMIRFDTHRE